MANRSMPISQFRVPDSADAAEMSVGSAQLDRRAWPTYTNLDKLCQEFFNRTARFCFRSPIKANIVAFQLID
ncbi:MAG: hypothetical protein DME77_07605 [Verrucomicrobia bacterium]|nr:MAG: hypothetical protein DME77_07605 [Verrucomicrobiota bacterium]